ncbi:hypothetical protein [Pseudomonas chlororaphis]|uniref:hypothetical protein n=1 Tax=Pseudomonas chlororaphis TaxID=587753 RepID=UPI0039839C6C
MTDSFKKSRSRKLVGHFLHLSCKLCCCHWPAPAVAFELAIAPFLAGSRMFISASAIHGAANFPANSSKN